MSCRTPAPASNEHTEEQACGSLDWISTAPSRRRSAGTGELKRLGRVDRRRHLFEAFAKRLAKEDIVVVEATSKAASVAAVIASHVKQVVIANPKQVRIIAHAKIKTDTIDAKVLASFTRALFCRKSGFRRSRHRHFAGR
jgi:hypothetical protein